MPRPALRAGAEPVLSRFGAQLEVALPLFVLIGLGYVTIRYLKWPASVSDGMSRFVFALAVPALLFQLMSERSDGPGTDPRVLVAFFGGALLVFVLGRLLGWAAFRLDGAQQSMFAMSGIFSNNVLLGLPLAQAVLGRDALAVVALVLVFNAPVLWTLLIVSVEWSRRGRMSWRALGVVLAGVLTNPIILAILAGTAFGFTGWTLPGPVDTSLDLLGTAALPTALVALGMSLAEYGVRDRWRISVTMTIVKLLVMPAVVWALALALGLEPLQTQVVVLMAATAAGVNTYLMARQVRALEGPVSASLVISTAASAVTTPLILTLVIAS